MNIEEKYWEKCWSVVNNLTEGKFWLRGIKETKDGVVFGISNGSFYLNSSRLVLDPAEEEEEQILSFLKTFMAEVGCFRSKLRGMAPKLLGELAEIRKILGS